MENGKEFLYEGYINIRPHGENESALFLGSDDIPLTEKVMNDLGTSYGKEVQVLLNYYISLEPKSRDELDLNYVMQISGSLEADYDDHYSELTGYLWTDEELSVDGHDILKELSATDNIGHYLSLRIIKVNVGVDNVDKKDT